MATSPYLTDETVLGASTDSMGLERQRKLAQALTSQAFNQPQGQMISGHYVAPSWTQQLAPALSAAVGLGMNESLDKKQLALAEALRGKQQEVMQAWSQAKTPQEKFAIGTSQYAPKELQAASYEMLKPQKLGEGETISQMNFGTGAYEPMAQGAPKTSEAIRGYQLAKQQGFPGTFIDYEMALKRAGASSVSVNTGQHGFDNALKLRSDFRAEPIYKGFEETKAAKLQIDQAAKMASPAGDLAAATKIMKILDPGSVVRESELGMAMAATGVEDRVKNYANMVITGQKLTPGQRKDFVELSDKLYNAAGQQFNQKRNEYAGIAERNKLDVEAAVGAPASLKTKQFSVQDQQALQWANANPNDPRAAQIKNKLGQQ
jgi:hypothetical protein